MSIQLVELIIFASITFLVINKLISTLGTTNKNDNKNNNSSFFGEPKNLEDVTPKESVIHSSIIKPIFNKRELLNIKGLIVEENRLEIESILPLLLKKIPYFKIQTFLNASRIAFQMIINTPANHEQEELIDKRYIDHFNNNLKLNYGECISDLSKLSAKIAEIYMFGHNIFIKVLFTGDNITSKIKKLSEEWTFCKSALTKAPNWHLSNIDKM